MQNNLNESINILMLNDIKEILKNEELKYIVIENNDFLDIKNVPIIYTDYLSILYDYLAYDYDNLDDKLKEKYRLLYKRIKLNPTNRKYIYDTKTYKKK